MNEILKFEGHDVRMIVKNGEPWWVAKDVCDVLGINNPSDAVKRIDTDDLEQIEVIDAIGRKQKSWVVNEPGLYSLILRSDKPQARRMKNWLTREVLPSIRKTGKYEVAAPAPTKFEIMRNMLDAWEAHEMQLMHHDRQIGSLNSHVTTLEHRVDMFGADTDYRTIRAYCRQHGIKVSERGANMIGKRAAIMCRNRGIEIGKVADERHGQVNSYPVDVIAEAVEANAAK